MQHVVASTGPARPQLELRDVTRSFGRLVAVNHVDLMLHAGERVAIIGPNGAGKSTLFNVISGLLPPTSGLVIFEGVDVTRMPVHTRAARGIGRSFQITSIYPHLSVFENVRVAVQAHSHGAWQMFASVRSLSKVDARAANVLRDVGLDERADLPAGMLSHGDRRLLDLGMALAGGTKLLLLDEPTAGMSPNETRHIAEMIPHLAGGRTFILVEHDMDVVLSVATRVLVLSRGTVLADGTPDEIQHDARVQEAYLGGVL
jgi:ABC-type branched-subunit amino acid transport system ATPase component